LKGKTLPHPRKCAILDISQKANSRPKQSIRSFLNDLNKQKWKRAPIPDEK